MTTISMDNKPILKLKTAKCLKEGLLHKTINVILVMLKRSKCSGSQ